MDEVGAGGKREGMGVAHGWLEVGRVGLVWYHKGTFIYIFNSIGFIGGKGGGYNVLVTSYDGRGGGRRGWKRWRRW